MKRWKVGTAVLLVLVAVIGFTARSVKATPETEGLSGIWDLYYTWEGYPEAYLQLVVTMTDKHNGTFEDGYLGGTVYKQGKKVTFTFYCCVFPGKKDGKKHLSGTMVDNDSGLTGTWYAIK
jgi:hypothetical protein